MVASSFLLDTHTLIWFQENSPKIPGSIMGKIQDTTNIILFSQISLFEITIKQKVGKLPFFFATIEEVYNQAIKDGFTFLPVKNQHIYSYNKIPLIEDHRDPFDRLFIATAEVENAIILSSDEKFKLYPDFIRVEW